VGEGRALKAEEMLCMHWNEDIKGIILMKGEGSKGLGTQKEKKEFIHPEKGTEVGRIEGVESVRNGRNVRGGKVWGKNVIMTRKGVASS